jgi:predicted DNA-binding protein YlxM (UPF0122 family)
LINRNRDDIAALFDKYGSCSGLDERALRILETWISGSSCGEIAETEKVGRQRISDIVSQSVDKMRKAFIREQRQEERDLDLASSNGEPKRVFSVTETQIQHKAITSEHFEVRWRVIDGKSGPVTLRVRTESVLLNLGGPDIEELQELLRRLQVYLGS